MITEDCVSFETSKLLKEKGFDEPCHALYHDGDDKIFFGLDVDSYHNSTLNVNCYACPTLQMTMKWLREVKHYYIQISIQNDGTYIGYVYRTDGFPYIGWDKRHVKETPEEAYESVLRYCLENLI